MISADRSGDHDIRRQLDQAIMISADRSGPWRLKI